MKKNFKHKGRKFQNSGYSDGGASLTKKTLKSWTPAHLSAVSDIDANLEILRARAADLFMNSPLGAAAVKTQVAGVINEGLDVFPRVNQKALGLSAADARDWANKTKQEFNFWAASQQCDFTKRNTFAELQRIAFQSSLIDGDSFCLFRRRTPTSQNPYSLRLQLIEAGRVSNPWTTNGRRIFNSFVEMQGTTKDSRIVNGIEVDSGGAIKAVWISNRIWNEFSPSKPALEFSRVKFFGDKSGTRNVLHLCNDSRIDQFRGEPYLAPVIEVLKNLSRYAESELTSSIIKTFLSVFFVQLGSETNYGLNQILPEQNDSLDVTEYKLGAGTISALPRGVDVKSIDASNSQSTFDVFTTQFCKQIGAALNLPIEVIMKTFNSSYSASKAALLQAENEFRQRRKSFIVDFCQPVYETWLAEAVAVGRVDAPGFFDDPFVRAQWSGADWHNETNHLLDPVKELQAAKLKLELGLSTYEKEAAELTGTDFFANMEALAIETQNVSRETFKE